MRGLTKILIVLVVLVLVGGISVRLTGLVSSPEERDAVGTTPIDIPTHRSENTLVFAYDTWTGTFLPIYILKAIFEDKLGYDVEIIELSVPDAYEQVALGRVDIYANGWFPSQDATYDKYHNLFKLGQCYGGKAKDAYEGWLVPADFARQYRLTHVADLYDQEVARALDTDGDGRGNLIGAPETWLASERNDEIMVDYGLAHLYGQEHSSEKELMERIEQRLSQGSPTLFYLCLPNAFPSKVPVSARLIRLKGTEQHLPLSFVRAVVRSDFIINHPEAAQILDRYRIPGADISQSMEEIAQKGESSKLLTDLAHSWIDDHGKEVDSWLEGISGRSPSPDPSLGTMTVAYSPEKEDLFLKLAIEFNISRSEDIPPIEPIRVHMADMLDDALSGSFTAISPDSSVWLDQLDRMWQQRNPGSPVLVGVPTRYAQSPIVIAMWERTAADMGYPGQSLGWDDLIQKVSRDPRFRWSHSSATTASGLLTTTAEFYAGAGKMSGLTIGDLTAKSTQDYVRNVEATLQRYGGESEDRVVIRMLAEAGRPLDAFVTQEQLVIYFNRNSEYDKLVAIYPREGTFWMDHPLVLLDGSWVTDEQKQAFRKFAAFVTEREQQLLVLREGYRPTGTMVSLQEEDSLIKPEYNVDSRKPSTLLEVPSAEVLEKIREAWRLLKKPANVYLVVDISLSMKGEKLRSAKAALLTLVAFSSDVLELDDLGPADRTSLEEHIIGLNAEGKTKLYDAVAYAYDKLHERGDSDRINVIVAMTDGQSEGDISIVELRLGSEELPILVFTVAYGQEADLDVLRRIARLGGGHAYSSDMETIGKLYELISAFF